MAKKTKYPKSFKSKKQHLATGKSPDAKKARRDHARKITKAVMPRAHIGEDAKASAKAMNPSDASGKRTTPTRNLDGSRITATLVGGAKKDITKRAETRNKNIRQTQTKRTRYEPHWEDKP
jgi:hypothetical protein